MGRAFVILLLVGSLAAHADDAELAKWGTSVDPDGSCKFVADKGTLQITAPGPIHDLSVELGRMNAPRVLKSFEGDFVAEVKVSGQFGPGEKTLAARTAYNGAGLLLMKDEDTYVRLERATLSRGGDRHYINFEVREFVRIRRIGRVDDAELKGGAPTWLRIKRVGNTVRGSYREGDGPWRELEAKTLDLPEGLPLQIGVSAVNASSQPFEPIFSDFQVKKLVPEDSLE